MDAEENHLNNRAELFYELAKGTFQLAGDDLIEAIILNLGRFFDLAFVATLENEEKLIFSLSTCVYRATAHDLALNFSGENTLCAQTYSRGVLICEEQANEHFKEDPILKNKNIESIVCLAMRSPSGEAAGVIAIGSRKIFTDIDLILEVLSLFVSPAIAELDKRNSQKELKEQRALLGDVSGSFPGAIFKMEQDAQGQLSLPLITKGILHLDPLKDPSRTETLPSTPWDFVFDDDRESFEFALKRSAAIESEEQSLAFDVRFRLKEQPKIWLRAIAQTRLDKNNKVIWSGVITDVTPQVEAERSLSLSYRVSDIEATVLDSTNRRQSIADSADTLCRAIESLEVGSRSILILPESIGGFLQAPSLEKSLRDELKQKPAKALSMIQDSKSPLMWNLPAEDEEWSEWKDFLNENNINYLAGCSMKHYDSPGMVIVLFKEKPNFPKMRLQLAIRRFSHLLRLVLQYCTG